MLERINYRGWQNSYRIFNPTVELVVLADVGPRIISYGFRNGENILHEVPEHAGLSGGREFRLYGGSTFQSERHPHQRSTAASADRRHCFQTSSKDGDL